MLIIDMRYALFKFGFFIFKLKIKYNVLGVGLFLNCELGDI